ncbi:uncharacterized protein MONOS_5407 [Monocercomonoides exilis]|uniref:uncharacterized protein n=1 Tax=Monocercomonoides exilis TaxID=2049356 RepID=UPI00355A42FA|nr:hypothetical protein MONOS_5407 [Monocercomonoides exilis]|eukprot:MONOS_5407.1-p1 / transcript=MONOS_5407.1 / gene=MONOS_5407 / organism=Monocercomonoides_exilis_PA203 / gene_product=unspecified product / transcript_product=unspecified product / location=Mono_scaffold00156:74230-98415(-) / protein_length=7986 / sequence_SO=supercontig / SO=protein_coding / is_pseudo=false
MNNISLKFDNRAERISSSLVEFQNNGTVGISSSCFDSILYLKNGPFIARGDFYKMGANDNSFINITSSTIDTQPLIQKQAPIINQCFCSEVDECICPYSVRYITLMNIQFLDAQNPVTGGILGCGESVIEFVAHNSSFINAKTTYSTHLRHTSGSATYSNDAFVSCTTSGDNGGGAIWCKNTNILVDHCVFNACAVYGDEPKGHGGGLYAREGGYKKCLNSNFTQNHADYAGAGVAFHNNSVHLIQNCTFVRNDAGYYSSYQSIGASSNSIFSANSVRNGSVTGFASAFSLQSATGYITVSNCEAIHGTAQDEIGAFYIGSPSHPADIRLSYLWFVNNVLSHSAKVFHANDVVVDKVWQDHMSDKTRWESCFSISDSPHVFFRVGNWPGGYVDDSYVPFPPDKLLVGGNGADWSNCGYNVSWKCRTIKYAVDRWGAPRRCNIQQDDDEYIESNININGDKNIILNGHGKMTTLKTDGTMITVSSSGKLNLSQFNIMWRGQDVIMKVTSGTSIIDNCAVTDDASQHSNGGVVLTGGSTTITSCSFTSLVTKTNPTIQVKQGSICNISSSSFTNINGTGCNGGVILGNISSGKSLNIMNTNFTNCSALSGWGGSVYVYVPDGGKFTVGSGGQVKFNKSVASVSGSNWGGGLGIKLTSSNSIFSLSNMSFSQCNAFRALNVSVQAPELYDVISTSTFSYDFQNDINMQLTYMHGTNSYTGNLAIPLIIYFFGKQNPAYVSHSDISANYIRCGFEVAPCYTIERAITENFQNSAVKNIVMLDLFVFDPITLDNYKYALSAKNTSYSVTFNTAATPTPGLNASEAMEQGLVNITVNTSISKAKLGFPSSMNFPSAIVLHKGNATLTLTDVILDGSPTSFTLFRITNGTLQCTSGCKIQGMTFSNSSAFVCDSLGKLIINNFSFTDYRCMTLDVGIVQGVGGIVEIGNSNFSSSEEINSSPVVLIGSSMNVSSCSFDSCLRANGNGGGICSQMTSGSYLKVYNTSFKSCKVNMVSGLGGGLYFYDNYASNFLLSDISFADCAAFRGPKIFISSNDLYLLVSRQSFAFNPDIRDLTSYLGYERGNTSFPIPLMLYLRDRWDFALVGWENAHDFTMCGFEDYPCRTIYGAAYYRFRQAGCNAHLMTSFKFDGTEVMDVSKYFVMQNKSQDHFEIVSDSNSIRSQYDGYIYTKKDVTLQEINFDVKSTMKNVQNLFSSHQGELTLNSITINIDSNDEVSYTLFGAFGGSLVLNNFVYSAALKMKNVNAHFAYSDLSSSSSITLNNLSIFNFITPTTSSSAESAPFQARNGALNINNSTFLNMNFDNNALLFSSGGTGVSVNSSSFVNITRNFKSSSVLHIANQQGISSSTAYYNIKIDNSSFTNCTSDNMCRCGSAVSFYFSATNGLRLSGVNFDNCSTLTENSNELGSGAFYINDESDKMKYLLFKDLAFTPLKATTDKFMRYFHVDAYNLSRFVNDQNFLFEFQPLYTTIMTGYESHNYSFWIPLEIFFRNLKSPVYVGEDNGADFSGCGDIAYPCLTINGSTFWRFPRTVTSAMILKPDFKFYQIADLNVFRYDISAHPDNPVINVTALEGNNLPTLRNAYIINNVTSLIHNMTLKLPVNIGQGITAFFECQSGELKVNNTLMECEVYTSSNSEGHQTNEQWNFEYSLVRATGGTASIFDLSWRNRRFKGFPFGHSVGSGATVIFKDCYFNSIFTNIEKLFLAENGGSFGLSSTLCNNTAYSTQDLIYAKNAGTVFLEDSNFEQLDFTKASIIHSVNASALIRLNGTSFKNISKTDGNGTVVNAGCNPSSLAKSNEQKQKNSESQLSIDNCSFVQCTTSKDASCGGAIYAELTSNNIFALSNTNFIECSVPNIRSASPNKDEISESNRSKYNTHQNGKSLKKRSNNLGGRGGGVMIYSYSNTIQFDLQNIDFTNCQAWLGHSLFIDTFNMSSIAEKSSFQSIKYKASRENTPINAFETKDQLICFELRNETVPLELEIFLRTRVPTVHVNGSRSDYNFIENIGVFDGGHDFTNCGYEDFPCATVAGAITHQTTFEKRIIQLDNLYFKFDRYILLEDRHFEVIAPATGSGGSAFYTIDVTQTATRDAASSVGSSNFALLVVRNETLMHQIVIQFPTQMNLFSTFVRAESNIFKLEDVLLKFSNPSVIPFSLGMSRNGGSFELDVNNFTSLCWSSMPMLQTTGANSVMKLSSVKLDGVIAKNQNGLLFATSGGSLLLNQVAINTISLSESLQYHQIYATDGSSLSIDSSTVSHMSFSSLPFVEVVHAHVAEFLNTKFLNISRNNGNGSVAMLSHEALRDTINDKFTINNCSFEGCSVKGTGNDGGALFVNLNPVFNWELKNSSFTSCYAPVNASIIQQPWNATHIRTFMGKGGAIFLLIPQEDVDFSLSDLTFTSNEADLGKNLFISGKDLIVSLRQHKGRLADWIPDSPTGNWNRYLMEGFDNHDPAVSIPLGYYLLDIKDVIHVDANGFDVTACGFWDFACKDITYASNRLPNNESLTIRINKNVIERSTIQLPEDCSRICLLRENENTPSSLTPDVTTDVDCVILNEIELEVYSITFVLPSITSSSSKAANSPSLSNSKLESIIKQSENYVSLSDCYVVPQSSTQTECIFVSLLSVIKGTADVSNLHIGAPTSSSSSIDANSNAPMKFGSVNLINVVNNGNLNLSSSVLTSASFTDGSLVKSIAGCSIKVSNVNFSSISSESGNGSCLWHLMGTDTPVDSESVINSVFVNSSTFTDCSVKHSRTHGGAMFVQMKQECQWKIVDSKITGCKAPKTNYEDFKDYLDTPLRNPPAWDYYTAQGKGGGIYLYLDHTEADWVVQMRREAMTGNDADYGRNLFVDSASLPISVKRVNLPNFTDSEEDIARDKPLFAGFDEHDNWTHIPIEYYLRNLYGIVFASIKGVDVSACGFLNYRCRSLNHALRRQGLSNRNVTVIENLDVNETISLTYGTANISGNTPQEKLIMRMTSSHTSLIEVLISMTFNSLRLCVDSTLPSMNAMIEVKDNSDITFNRIVFEPNVGEQDWSFMIVSSGSAYLNDFSYSLSNAGFSSESLAGSQSNSNVLSYKRPLISIIGEQSKLRLSQSTISEQIETKSCIVSVQDRGSAEIVSCTIEHHLSEDASFIQSINSRDIVLNITSAKTYNQSERGSDISKGYTEFGRGGGIYLHMIDADVSFSINDMKNETNKADFGRDIFISSPDLLVTMKQQCIVPHNDILSDQVYPDEEIQMMSGYDNHDDWTHVPLIYYLKTLPEFIFVSDKGINVSSCGFIMYQCKSMPLAFRRQGVDRRKLQVDTDVIVREAISLSSGTLSVKGKNDSIIHSVTFDPSVANSVTSFYNSSITSDLHQLLFIVPSDGTTLQSQFIIDHSDSNVTFENCSAATNDSSPMLKPFVTVRNGKVIFDKFMLKFGEGNNEGKTLIDSASFIIASSQSQISITNSVMEAVKFSGLSSFVNANENASIEIRNCSWNNILSHDSSFLSISSPRRLTISDSQITSVYSSDCNGSVLHLSSIPPIPGNTGSVSLANSSFSNCSVAAPNSQFSYGGGAILATVDSSLTLQFSNLSFAECSVSSTQSERSTCGGAIFLCLESVDAPVTFGADLKFERNAANFGKNIFISSQNLTASITRSRYQFFKCYDELYTQGDWAKKWVWDRNDFMGYDNHNSAEVIPLGYYLMDQQEQIFLSDEGKDVTACGFYDYHCKTFNYAIWRQTKNNVYLSTTRKNVTVNESVTLAEEVVLSEGTMRLRSNRSDDSVPVSSRIVVSPSSSSTSSSLFANAVQDAIIVSSIPSEYFDIEFHVPSLLSAKSSIIHLDDQIHVFVRCGLTYQTPGEGLSFIFIAETRGSLILDDCFIGTPVHSSTSFSSLRKFNEITPKYLFNNGSFIKVSGTSAQAELRNMQVHNTEHGDSSSLVEVIGGASLTLNRDEFESSQMVKSSLIRGNDANNVTVVDTIFHSITTQQKGGSCVKIGDDSIVKTIESYTPHQQLYRHTPTRNTVEAIFSFRNCTFDACASTAASSDGGALQMILKPNPQTSSSQQLLISGCSFIDCTCPTLQSENGKGGAIFLYLDDPLIDWCISTPEFETNKATLGLNLFVSSYKLNESITATRLPFISASEYTFDHSLYQGYNEFNSWKAIPLPFYILPLHQHICIKETGVNSTACGFTDYQCESLHYALYRQNKPTTKEEVAIMERVLLEEEIKLTGKELEVISNKLIDPSAQTLNAQIVVLNGERNELDGIIESTKKALFDSIEFIVPKAIQSHSSVVKVTSGEFLLNRSIITPSDPLLELSCRFISATSGKVIIKSISFASNLILVSSSSAHSFSASNSDNGVGSFLFVEGSSTEGTIDRFSFTQVKCKGRTSVLGIDNGATLSITNSDFSHLTLDENCIVEADNIKSLSISDTNISSLGMKSGSTISVSTNDALTVENCSFSSIKLDTIGGSTIHVKDGTSTHSKRVSNKANASSMDPSSFKRNSNTNLEAVHIASCYFSECAVCESSCTGGAIMITPTNMMDVDIDSCSFSNCVAGSSLFGEASISSTSPENTNAPTRGGAIYFYLVDASANWRINNPTWSSIGEANMNNAQIGRDFFISSANLTHSVQASCLPFFDNVNYDECYYFDQSSLRGYDEHDDWTSIPIGFYLLRQHASIYVSSVGYDTTACGFTMYHCHSLPYALNRQQKTEAFVTVNYTMELTEEFSVSTNSLLITANDTSVNAQFVVVKGTRRTNQGFIQNAKILNYALIDFCVPSTLEDYKSLVYQTNGNISIEHCSLVPMDISGTVTYPIMVVTGGKMNVSDFQMNPTMFAPQLQSLASTYNYNLQMNAHSNEANDLHNITFENTSLLIVEGQTSIVDLSKIMFSNGNINGQIPLISSRNSANLTLKNSTFNKLSLNKASILYSAESARSEVNEVKMEDITLNSASLMKSNNSASLTFRDSEVRNITSESGCGAAMRFYEGTDEENNGKTIKIGNVSFDKCSVTETNTKGGAIYAEFKKGSRWECSNCSFVSCSAPFSQTYPVSSNAKIGLGGAISLHFHHQLASWMISTPSFPAKSEANANQATLGRNIFVSSPFLNQTITNASLPFVSPVYPQSYYFDHSEMEGFNEHNATYNIPLTYYLLNQHQTQYVSTYGNDTTACGYDEYHCYSLPWTVWRQRSDIKHVTINDTMYLMNQFRVGDLWTGTNLFYNLSIISSKEERHAQFVVRDLQNNEDFTGVFENSNTNTLFNKIDFCLPETIERHSSFLRQISGTVNVACCSLIPTEISHTLKYPMFYVEGGQLNVEAFDIAPCVFVQNTPNWIKTNSSSSMLASAAQTNDAAQQTILSSTSLLTINGMTASAVLDNFSLTSVVSKGNNATIDVSNRSKLFFKKSTLTELSNDYSPLISSSSCSSVEIESIVVNTTHFKDASILRSIHSILLNLTNSTFADTTRTKTGGSAIWIECGEDSQFSSNSGEAISLRDCSFTRCRLIGEEALSSLKNTRKTNSVEESNDALPSIFDSSCGGAIFASLGRTVSVQLKGCRFSECAVPNEESTTISSSSNAASANGCGGAILLFLTDSEADWIIETPTFPVNPSSFMNKAKFGRDLFVTSPALNHSIIHSRLPFFPLNRRFDHSSMEGYDEHNSWTSIPLGFYLLPLETSIYISTEGFNTTACGFDDYHCESLNYAIHRQNNPQKGNVTVIGSFELSHEFSVPNELFVLTAPNSSIAEMIIMNVEESNQNGLFESNSNTTLKQLKIKVPKLISNHEAIFTVSGNSFTLTSCSLVAVEDRTINNAFMKVTAGKVEVSKFTFIATETTVFASSNSFSNLSDNILNFTSLFSLSGSSTIASFDSLTLKQITIDGDKSVVEIQNGASLCTTNSVLSSIRSLTSSSYVRSTPILTSDQAELLALNNVSVMSISFSSSSVLYSRRTNKLNVSCSHFGGLNIKGGNGTAFCFDEPEEAESSVNNRLIIIINNAIDNCFLSESNSVGGAMYARLRKQTRFEVKNTSFESCAVPNTQGSSGKGGAVYVYAIDSNLDWLFSPIAFPLSDERTANKAEFGRDMFVDSYKLNETITRSSLPFIPIIPPDCYYFDHSSLSGYNEHNNWTVIPLVYYNLDQHKTVYVSSDGVDTTACGFDEYHCKTLHWAVWRQTSVKDKNVTVNSSFTLVNEFNVSFDSFILKGNESNCKCFITQTVPNSNMKGIIENHNIASITDIHFVVPEVLNRHSTLMNNRKGTLTIQRSSLIPPSSNRITFSFLDATYGTVSVTDFIVEPMAIGQSSANVENILLTNSCFISSQGQETVVSMTNLAVSSISSTSSSPLMQFGCKTTTVIKNSKFEQISSTSSSVICFSSVKNATISSCVFTAISKQNGDGSCIEHRGETDSQLISRIENCSFTDCHISKTSTSNSKKSNDALSNTIKNNQKDQSRYRNNNQEGLSGGALFIEMNYLAVIEVFNCAFNDCSAPSEPGSKGKGGSIGIYTQNLDASFCLRDLNFTSSSAELGLNVFVDGLYLPKEITYSTLTFFKVFDGWNVHELEGFDEHNSTIAIPLGYYLLELSNWIHTSTEGLDVSACGFWNYTCNSLNYAIERDPSKMQVSIDKSCYFKGESVISRLFLIDGKAVDSEIPSTASQHSSEKKGIIRFIDSPANGIRKAPITVQSSVEIDNCIFCIPSSFPSHSSLLHVAKDALKVSECEILHEDSFIDPFDSTLTSSSFTCNDLHRYRFSFSLILISGGRLDVEDMQLTNFEFNAPIFSLEEGALFSLKKLNVSGISFSNGAVISMKNAHPKEDFSLKLEDSIFVGLTQERSGPCVLSVNHGKASLTRIIVEKCVSESSLGCALNVENAVLAVSDCVFNGEIRNATTSSDEALTIQKHSMESNEQLIDGYNKGLISKNALLSVELEAEEDIYALCDWKGSILRVVNSSCDISASQLSNCESGAFSVTGGNVVIKDVVFESNGIESKMYPKARKDIICDGNADLDILSSIKPSPPEAQSAFNNQNYPFVLSRVSGEAEGTTEGGEESKEEEEEQVKEMEHLWILSASCTLHNDASITKGFLFHPSVSKMTRSDQPEIAPDKPEDTPIEEEQEEEVKEEEDQTTEIEGDSTDAQKSAYFKRSRNHRKQITTEKSKILNTDSTEEREPITVTFTGTSLLPCNVTAEMRYILKDGSLNRTTDVAVAQFVDPTTVKVVLNADLVLGDEEEEEEKKRKDEEEKKKKEEQEKEEAEKEKQKQHAKNKRHLINNRVEEDEEVKQVEDVYVCLRFWNPSGTVLRTTAFYMNTRNTPPLPDPPVIEPEPEPDPVMPPDDGNRNVNEQKTQSRAFPWWVILIVVGVVSVVVVIVIVTSKKKKKNSQHKQDEAPDSISSEDEMEKEMTLDESDADFKAASCNLTLSSETLPVKVVDEVTNGSSVNGIDSNDFTSSTDQLLPVKKSSPNSSCTSSTASLLSLNPSSGLMNAPSASKEYSVRKISSLKSTNKFFESNSTINNSRKRSFTINPLANSPDADEEREDIRRSFNRSISSNSEPSFDEDETLTLVQTPALLNESRGSDMFDDLTEQERGSDITQQSNMLNHSSDSMHSDLFADILSTSTFTASQTSGNKDRESNAADSYKSTQKSKGRKTKRGNKLSKAFHNSAADNNMASMNTLSMTNSSSASNSSGLDEIEGEEDNSKQSKEMFCVDLDDFDTILGKSVDSTTVSNSILSPSDLSAYSTTSTSKLSQRDPNASPKTPELLDEKMITTVTSMNGKGATTSYRESQDIASGDMNVFGKSGEDNEDELLRGMALNSQAISEDGEKKRKRKKDKKDKKDKKEKKEKKDKKDKKMKSSNKKKQQKSEEDVALQDIIDEFFLNGDLEFGEEELRELDELEKATENQLDKEVFGGVEEEGEERGSDRSLGLMSNEFIISEEEEIFNKAASEKGANNEQNLFLGDAFAKREKEASKDFEEVGNLTVLDTEQPSKKKVKTKKEKKEKRKRKKKENQVVEETEKVFEGGKDRLSVGYFDDYFEEEMK